MKKFVLSFVLMCLLNSCVENSKRKIYLHASSNMFMGHKYLTLFEEDCKFEICEMISPSSGTYELHQDTILLTYPDKLLSINSGDSSYLVPINEWLQTILIIDSVNEVITSLNGRNKFIVSFQGE